MNPSNSMTIATKTVRPLRKDAAQHREQLLAAAVQVFNERGLDASVTEIARAAGVGIGTLYRRFPTKDALVDALIREILSATIEMAHDALTAPGGTGLELFLEASTAYQAAHAGYLRRLWNTDHEMVMTARQLIARLLVDAKKHGLIRHDLTNTDLSLAMFSLLGVLEATLPVASDAWRRHLDLLIAGMRPAPSNLPHHPLSAACLDEIQANRKTSL
jgi:AcrR family transcriptional regulator